MTLNRKTTMISKKTALDIFKSAINSVTAENLFNNRIKVENNVLIVPGKVYDLSQFENLYVIGAGKASAHLAKALETKLGPFIKDGAVITKYGHTVPCDKIRIYEAGHPVPDLNSIKYSSEIVKIAQKAQTNDLVICLLSGGGSALLEALPENISLQQLQQLNDALLKSGANIDEINTVRKHVSLLKGGKLAKIIYPASGLTLIISDVLNDPLESIASGPTAPDNSSFNQAFQVVLKYDLKKVLDAELIQYLRNHSGKTTAETIKGDSTIWSRFYNCILGNNKVALEAAGKKAQSLGFTCKIIKSDFQGEAGRVAEKIALDIKKSISHQKHPLCLLFGGESTVVIKGKGKGGRNQELALAALIALKNIDHPYVLLSAGTDGTDGPTDAAGAVIDNDSWEVIKKNNLNPLKFLENNDSYTFFKKLNRLVKTGPTGTNVMDLIVVLIGM